VRILLDPRSATEARTQMNPRSPAFVSEFPGMAEPGEAQMARYLFADLDVRNWIVGTMTRNGEAQRSRKPEVYVENGAKVYAKA
jgi:hypothetical protein